MYKALLFRIFVSKSSQYLLFKGSHRMPAFEMYRFVTCRDTKSSGVTVVLYTL